MTELDKVIRWVNLGNQVLSGVVDMVRAIQGGGGDAPTTEDARKEINRIDQELEAAVERERALFRH